ncbi:hypothetical protein A2818_00260 [Candidatus Nomurabacteria bacterium RIFCSPHIGHO2_01_FULL_40_12]|uniref:Uncharacterized protein n=1 Tax=Candidatus Nomurabacteria bacterium RIFCSPHIGHO2_01_FULL_40_12 TaxID=1801737 RepID=A0A1F6UZY4_9BACT|nr:MAG: hypothetical protein A2818_00260 [Candidatus Nomurabacteria bacterium RIFCSPHIGHO2_01_FULL_40_12]
MSQSKSEIEDKIEAKAYELKKAEGEVEEAEAEVEKLKKVVDAILGELKAFKKELDKIEERDWSKDVE